MKYFKTIIFLLILTIPFDVFAADNVRTITVTGKSEKTLEAQYAIVSITIKHVKDELSDSYEETIGTIFKLTKALKNLRLKEEHITKSFILQGEETAWEKNRDVHKGYFSKCQLEILVNNLGIIGSVYKELANYKSVTIKETEFKRKDEFELRQSELKKALLAAKKKAEFMAHTLNAKIGKVHSIREINVDNYYTRTVGANVTQRQISNQTGYGDVKIIALVMVEFELE